MSFHILPIGVKVVPLRAITWETTNEVTLTQPVLVSEANRNTTYDLSNVLVGYHQFLPDSIAGYAGFIYRLCDVQSL